MTREEAHRVLRGACSGGGWSPAPRRREKPPEIQLNSRIEPPKRSGPTVAERILDSAKSLEPGVTAEGIPFTRPIRRLVTGGVCWIEGVSL